MEIEEQIYLHYLVTVLGGMVQNFCLVKKLIGHNKSLNWLRRAIWSQDVYGFCDASNCTAEGFNRFSNWKRLLRVIGDSSVSRVIQPIHSEQARQKLRQGSPFEGEFFIELASKVHHSSLKKNGGLSEEVGWLRYGVTPKVP